MRKIRTETLLIQSRRVTDLANMAAKIKDAYKNINRKIKLKNITRMAVGK